jgi:spermidine synthase
MLDASHMHDDARAAGHKYVAIGLVACSMLMHEILLTRICALRLQFHFAFLVISNCLLGLGASGSLLSVYQDRWRREQRAWLGYFTLAYTLCLVVTYVVLREYPIAERLVLSKPADLLALSGFALAGAVPFVFGGVVVGMLLTFNAERVNRLYAVDLIGAGIGCIGCPLLLPRVGAAGVFLVTVLLGIIASVVVLRARFGGAAIATGAVAGLIVIGLLPSLDQRFPMPSKGEVDIPRAFEGLLKLGKPFSIWTSNSRIDLVRAPKGMPPVVFMRGTKKNDLPPFPEWAGISQDATAGTFILDYSETPSGLEMLRGSMYSASYRLKPGARVLVIGLGGGNDVWAAKANGALSAKAIELNWPIVDIHRKLLPRFSKKLLADPSVQFVVDEGRSALMRETTKYDVIQMSGIDTWTALASGAYVLAENYLYTREALASMYQRLAPDGVIQVARFAAEMEALRLLSNMRAALSDVGSSDEVEHSVMALRTPDHMMAVMLKKGTWSAEEQASTGAFAERNGIDIVYLPDRPGSGVINDFIRAKDRHVLIDDFPTNIEPTDDDRPYFFNYAKWQHPIESMRHFSDHPAVSQGNPLFILMQLGLSIVLSALFVLLPLRRRGRPSAPSMGLSRYGVYFAGLGLGFIFIEIAVIQKLTLFLGQPVYSLTVTLFSLLVFTGVGSLLFGARFAPGDRRVWVVPAALVLYLGLFALGAQPFVMHFIGLALPLRIAITVALLAPLGCLLGVPFAHGIRTLERDNPSLGPWAWAINGCMSVIGSILTVIVSMNFGFAVVLWIAAITYIVAFAALDAGASPSA